MKLNKMRYQHNFLTCLLYALSSTFCFLSTVINNCSLRFFLRSPMPTYFASTSLAPRAQQQHSLVVSEQLLATRIVCCIEYRARITLQPYESWSFHHPYPATSSSLLSSTKLLSYSSRWCCFLCKNHCNPRPVARGAHCCCSTTHTILVLYSTWYCLYNCCEVL